MAFYTKTHTSRKAAAAHMKKIRNRGGVAKVIHSGGLLTRGGMDSAKIEVHYYFPRKKKK